MWETEKKEAIGTFGAPCCLVTERRSAMARLHRSLTIYITSLTLTTIPEGSHHCRRGCGMCPRSQTQQTLGPGFKLRTLYCQKFLFSLLPSCLGLSGFMSIFQPSKEFSMLSTFIDSSQNEITAASPGGEGPSHFASNLVFPIQGWQVATVPPLWKCQQAILEGKRWCWHSTFL